MGVTHDIVPAHPYSPAFRVGDTAYVSGALGVDEDGTAVLGDVADAMTAAMARLTERLATVDMTLSDVVKLTYFVTDVTTRDHANRQLVQVFSEPRPARSFVEVSALPYGAIVEIEAIAVAGSRRTPE